MNAKKAKLLLDAGAQIRNLRVKREEYKDYDALMYATKDHQWELALLYLKHGCNPNYRTPDGKSALSIAQEHAEDNNSGGVTRNDFLRALAGAMTEAPKR